MFFAAVLVLDFVRFRPTLGERKVRSQLVRATRWFLASATVLACASTQQYSVAMDRPNATVATGLKAPDGKARIYVMRKKKLFGAAIGIRVSDSGRSIGSVGP